MAHILLGIRLSGDHQLITQLNAWGMTTGAWTDGGEGCLPGIWDCDALLVDAEQAACLPSQEPSAERGSAAPVLVWDGVMVSAPDREVCPTVMPISAGGGLLASVQVCVAHASALRENKGTLPVLETNHLQVIEHELLTPLTAIKTALEVLAGDLGDFDPYRNDTDPKLGMVKLALRNVNRLCEAVDWSRDLLFTPRQGQPCALVDEES